MTQVAANRTQALIDTPPDASARYVLYWMTAARRVRWNFALERAAGWARELNLPLVVFEPLRCSYQWASDRLHRFILDGMAENARRLDSTPVTYFPYVEAARSEGRGLLAALAADAAVVITDDYPAFFLPRAVSTAAAQLRVRFEQVDGNGLLPMRLADQAFPTAYAFRRFVQRTLPAQLAVQPAANPLARLPVRRATLDPALARRWPAADPELLSRRGALSSLPIRHDVPPASTKGGSAAAERALGAFLQGGLPRYAAERQALDRDPSSHLSPYLHFGHLSSHEVVARVLDREGWLGDLTRRPTGAREGWWGLSAPAEAFLDQVVTWRELGFNMCALRPDYDRYDSLPAWARATLGAHASDDREHVYTLDEFARGRTHDPLWNAAQGQLREEGHIHNYLRMLWGKKILEWSPSPEEALAVMIELNNRYALDGRDPNSYSGIFWTLGRYDRPWAPERAVFGTVRYMSSASTARKMKVKDYVARYAPEEVQQGLGF